MSQEWQQEYSRELKRTAGYGATFERLPGGWWKVRTEGGGAFFRNVRRSEVLTWIERLRKFPNCES